MEQKVRIPLRRNALLMVLIAAALAVFVIVIIPNPSTALIVAIAMPVIAGSMAVVDKLCSPEPPKDERKPPSDEHYAFVERMFEKGLAAVGAQGLVLSAEADVHKRGDRG
ncbi:MAG: hypothetical protein OXC31_07860 [Spirochaetaceae bacterium]|nr:hypothetical protein [Spirochaetaceae bacterium]